MVDPHCLVLARTFPSCLSLTLSLSLSLSLCLTSISVSVCVFSPLLPCQVTPKVSSVPQRKMAPFPSSCAAQGSPIQKAVAQPQAASWSSCLPCVCLRTGHCPGHPWHLLIPCVAAPKLSEVGPARTPGPPASRPQASFDSSLQDQLAI